MTLEVGQIVDERYRIVKLLGQGGMGAVYRAWDTRLGRLVALKEMIPQAGLDEAFIAQLREQFQQEAQVLANLVHPNLVRVTDHFYWSGNAYLVMDFVEGESLADRIQRQGTQPEAELLRWAGQLLDALQYCHAHGVIHRDIKPQNIIITVDGQAVLVDFGLVKLWDPDDPQTRTVMRGAGTPEYAPPEQYDPGSGHTDPRSDIYSLGATLYHALTGQMPPTATRRMVTPGLFIHPRQFNAAVSPATEAAILRAMELAMDRRFQSAVEMARALGVARAVPAMPRPAAPAPAVSAAPPAPAMPAVRPVRARSRSPLLWFGLAAAVLCIGLCIILVATGILSSLLPSSGGGVLFQDDFSDPSSGWEVGTYENGSVGYGDGFYFVISTRRSVAMWGSLDREFTDVVVDVDVTQIASPANNDAFGVRCRGQAGTTGEGSDGYALMISGGGFYSIQIIRGGNYDPLISWTRSDVIHTGNATNHIRAACQGSHLTLAVNGVTLAQVDNASYPSGTIGLIAATLGDQMTEIHFDNLVVSAP